MKFIASPLELILFGIFVFYLIFQVDTPNVLLPYIDNVMGMVTIIGITLYLFLHSHPILGVLSIFVAYEVLRRSTVSMKRIVMFEPNPVQTIVDNEMKAMNPPTVFTLEEQIVQSITPQQNLNPKDYIESSYKPVSESIHEATEL